MVSTTKQVICTPVLVPLQFLGECVRRDYLTQCISLSSFYAPFTNVTKLMFSHSPTDVLNPRLTIFARGNKHCIKERFINLTQAELFWAAIRPLNQAAKGRFKTYKQKFVRDSKKLLCFKNLWVTIERVWPSFWERNTDLQTIQDLSVALFRLS